MNTLETPYWCSESEITNTYVASACPYAEDPLREPLDAAAQLFRRSTDVFTQYTEENPLQLNHLDFTRADAWNALSGQLVKRYRASHWELLHSDPDYRDALGEAVDMYNVHYSSQSKRAVEKPSTRRRRHIQEGQQLVKGAAEEGLATAVAAYGVVPGVVGLRKSQLPNGQKISTSHSLLPAVGELSRHLARTSKHGNDRLLRALAGLPLGRGSIHYASLRLHPTALDLSTGRRGQQVLRTIGTHKEPRDLNERFRGCPALHYGSITRINKLLGQIIIDNGCYERAFA